MKVRHEIEAARHRLVNPNNNSGDPDMRTPEGEWAPLDVPAVVYGANGVFYMGFLGVPPGLEEVTRGNRILKCVDAG